MVRQGVGWSRAGSRWPQTRLAGAMAPRGPLTAVQRGAVLPRRTDWRSAARLLRSLLSVVAAVPPLVLPTLRRTRAPSRSSNASGQRAAVVPGRSAVSPFFGRCRAVRSNRDDRRGRGSRLAARGSPPEIAPRPIRACSIAVRFRSGPLRQTLCKLFVLFLCFSRVFVARCPG